MQTTLQYPELPNPELSLIRMYIEINLWKTNNTETEIAHYVLDVYVQSAVANYCCVCQNETTGAHRCSNCGPTVHATCGKVDGPEGYGANVRCNKCHKPLAALMTEIS
jgi:hypothetical protein